MTGPEGKGAALSAIRSVVRRNRRLTEFLQRAHYRFTHRSSETPILVHQMARVGSITVLRAIRAHFPGAHVFHTHYLHPRTIAAEFARLDVLHAARGDVGLSRELLAAELLDERLRRGGATTPEKWRVVTLVRDPVARTVSAFFRHFAQNHPSLPARFHEDPANVPQLLEHFLAPDEEERRVTLHWFDAEVRDPLHIDVLAAPFDPSVGVATYRSARCDLLLLRTEDLDRVGDAALSQFLASPALALRTRNRGEDQPYGAAYSEFLRLLRLPHWYLDAMYGSALAQRFYTAGELERFRVRWETGRRAE